MEKIKFFDSDTEESLEFYVLEQTKISGITYLLVTEDEEGDSDAFIMKELSGENEEESVIQMVEDDKELEVIAKVFSELLEDVDIEL